MSENKLFPDRMDLAAVRKLDASMGIESPSNNAVIAGTEIEPNDRGASTDV